MLEGRAKKLAHALGEGFEAALIGTPQNRFYLLDFDAHDAGTLLVLPERMVYIIDSRYIEAARKAVRNAEVLLEQDAPAQLAEQLRAEGVRRVHLESGITLQAWKRLQDKIPFVEYDISDTLSKALMGLREIKDEEELARMQRAQDITDAAFEHILPFIKPGVAELELALELETFMRKNGADGPAFETICVAGANTSKPHGVPGAYRVQPGDLITMDYGARYRGYCSDMTRTVACGEPGEEKRRLYGAVLQAHLAGLQAAAAGKQGRAVDKVARDAIDEAGYAGFFGHGLGHAVGIDIHEDPRFSPKGDAVVKDGMVMTVEPGIYLPGQYGCRIEDMVRITQTGCVSFTKSPKQLMVL